MAAVAEALTVTEVLAVTEALAMIKASAEKVYFDWLANRAAEMTTHGQPVKAPARLWFRSEHSPIRAYNYWIEIYEVPTFVSVHLVRHKIGVEHFVQSMRDDRGGTSDQTQIHRLTPLHHGLLINAQAVIAISRKRLCYGAHKRTVAVWRRVLKAIGEVEPDLVNFCVPECVYRGGICPEFKECKPGIKKVVSAYDKYRDLFPIKVAQI